MFVIFKGMFFQHPRLFCISPSTLRSLVTKLLFIGYKRSALLSIWDCFKLDALSKVFCADAGSLMEESGQRVIYYCATRDDSSYGFMRQKRQTTLWNSRRVS